ncbi:hypothetical protein GJ744_011959 [Endocarpon pusillum]|uniref:Uncharacterized protein n=1 Tax=Endocarpon pusillum TaxID=364733 RepID=A0A8H7ATR0_9EURO|nr:hypothetical protein GJ744_011959 [Endocarpon pusillum]
MANPYQVRPFAVDPKRIHRGSLSPDDAAAMSRGRQPTVYDNTEIFFQQVNPVMTHIPRNGSLSSLDSIPSRRSSNTSWVSNYTQPTVPSPEPGTFSLGSKPSHPGLQRGLIFKRISQGVYDCILEQLQDLHSDRLSPSCATCYMRDLVALQLTSRSWDKAVRKTLYTKIHISDNDSPTQLKKYKMKYGTRLRLLRRTLRERQMLGALVKELTVPDPAIPPLLPNGRPNPGFVEYRDLLASLVMVCPNLERLQGFYTFYNHEFDRLTHALSTRRRLKEHVWIVSENQAVTQRSHYQVSPGLLDEHQVYQFMHYHYAWSQLETLMFCSPGGTGVLEHELFIRVFQLLPSLRHLCVSCFDGDDFMDQTLLALPALSSLRLEECPGISGSGLSRWAASPAAHTVESLTLIHQNLLELVTISKILASLRQLLKFTIVQADVSPSMPDSLLILQPILASPKLKYLHWDVAPSGQYTSTKYYADLPPSSQVMQTANSHLAASILHAGFPNLVALRAPQDLDPPGVLQEVCRPTTNASILLPADRYGLPPKSRGRNSAMPEVLPTNNSLHAARVRAQSYIDSASKSKKEFCKVIITDHSNQEASSHKSSSSHHSVSTDPTDPGDLFSEPQDHSLETGVDHALWPITPSNKQFSTAILSMLDASSSEKQTTSVCRSDPTQPVKLHEYSLAPFLGRVSVSVSSPASSVLNPPRFNLLPDVPGYDMEGGIIGWADLLRLKEKDDRAVNGPAWIRDGCTGRWNQGCARGPGWWRHTERERRSGRAIGTGHFF